MFTCIRHWRVALLADTSILFLDTIHDIRDPCFMHKEGFYVFFLLFYYLLLEDRGGREDI
jgi:hypothetical protein